MEHSPDWVTVTATPHAAHTRPHDFDFGSLVVSAPEPLLKERSTTALFSLGLHALLIAALVLVPLFLQEVLPEPDASLRAFFVTPPELAPAPPPPPPPAVGARSSTRPATPPKITDPGAFTAPTVTPDSIVPEPGLDLGVEGGVPGGVEGGIPGGVVGGVVGGLPANLPAPALPARVVRVGGVIIAPKLVKRVAPIYPELATQARLSGLVIIEAQVDTDGVVESVKVLRGAPLFDEPALEAVRQWRYQPLLLNGERMKFIVVVTVVFNLKNPSGVGE